MQKNVYKRKRASNSSVSSNSQESRELLKSIIHFMKQNQQLALPELINIYSESSPEESIPVSIFSNKLSPSESLCKFLKDNRTLSFHEIAVLLNRDDRSIWTSYTRASKKQKIFSQPTKDNILIPITIFADRKLSILEHVVNHLNTSHNMSNSKIASLLMKNPSSIATVANRAKKKKEATRTR